MQCKLFPHECIGAFYLCPFTDKCNCAIKPLNLQAEVKELEVEWKEAVGF